MPCDRPAGAGIQDSASANCATAIEKASRGPAGELVIASVYRPEYLTVKGELQELELMATQKNCRNVLRTQSDGAIQ